MSPVLDELQQAVRQLPVGLHCVELQRYEVRHTRDREHKALVQHTLDELEEGEGKGKIDRGEGGKGWVLGS